MVLGGVILLGAGGLAVLAGMFFAAGGGSTGGGPPGSRGGAGAPAGGRLRGPPAVGELPGAPPFPPELRARIEAALAARGPDYRPHTRHLRSDGSPRYTNRLILESSPYLLQHAHNPVDWYPWGEEAFARARAEGKPVLLSIGYSTCHWCHVMEEESFEDEQIARYLNEHYVAIKVDREQRPDVDALYMVAVQAISGSGGWPMTVWLTADRKPFYGGTYFPPRDGDRGMRLGFLTLLERLYEVYRQEPDRVASASAEIAGRVARALAPAPGSVVGDGPAIIRRAAEHFRDEFDRVNGGFGTAPKFPRSVSLDFLLRFYRRTGGREAVEMVNRTLAAMAAGGIHDHIGGGFHRYATDAGWLVPHFEKMLYDNALLATSYLEAYQVTGREDFAAAVRDILGYLEREMSAPGGGFYSATDADSEGEEGKFYVWSRQEVTAVLGAQRAGWFCDYYGVSAGGNFAGGKSVLHVARGLETVARDHGLEPAELRAALAEARSELYAARLRRVPPFKDTKILVSWNGLAISAFARAASVLGERSYAARAVAAAEFVLDHMQAGGGRLHRSYFGGKATGTAYLDDYAFFAAGLLDLYEATFDARWLREAIALGRILEEHFWDAQGGGYFVTPDDGEQLFAREKPGYDGAEPSGNSVAIANLLRLAELTGEDRYRAMADKALGAFAELLRRSPAAAPRMLSALDFRLDSPKEIVIVKPDAHSSAEPMLSRLARTFLPNRVLVVVTQGEDQAAQARLVPLVAGKVPLEGKTTAYVCEHGACELPTTDPEVFAAQIARVARLTPQAAPSGG